MEKKEKVFTGARVSGFTALFVLFLVICLSAYLITLLQLWSICAGIALAVLSVILVAAGLTIIEPNEARVIVFFGKYRGTITDNGFFWINPFNERKKITMRARNLDVLPVKVNDKVGNPVMIGAVMVWKVKDTYKAMFDIDTSSVSGIESGNKNTVWTIADSLNKLPKLMQSYENFVKTQSDAALRQIAGMYAYDSMKAAATPSRSGRAEAK
jgi:regulator of protease activity HflC (stomatin/prohibitin superfamily)